MNVTTPTGVPVIDDVALARLRGEILAVGEARARRRRRRQDIAAHTILAVTTFVGVSLMAIGAITVWSWVS